LRSGVPAPLEIPGFRIARFEEAGDIQRIAADSDNHAIPDDERRRGREVLLLDVGNLNAPAHLAAILVERDQIAVWGDEEQPVPINPRAAIADVDSTLGFPMEMPQLPAGSRIDGPGVIRHGEVQDAVDLQRSRFDLYSCGRNQGTEVAAVDPGERQAADISRIDLL